MNNNLGISNMGGNMQGTPIAQILNNVDNNVLTNQNNSIHKLVKKINDNDKIQKLKKIKKENNDDDDNDNNIDIDDNDIDDIDDIDDNNKKKYIKKDIKKNKRNKNNITKKEKDIFQIPELIKDAGLIWIIYLVLSINIIKNFVAQYLTVLNPNEEGVVSFKGVAIYGFLLAIMYIVIKFGLQHFNKY